MGKKSSGSPPPAPDPYETAKAQGEQDRATMQYSLDNSRTNTVNPFGSTTWQNNKTFDQAGFDAAMAAYKPTEIRTQAAAPSSGDREGIWDMLRPGSNAGESTVTYDYSGQPKREDFEGRDDWTNTQTLSPESQGIYDSSTDKLQQSIDGMNLGDLDGWSTDSNRYNQAVADAVYKRARLYTDPADAQARDAMQSNLADRGFQVGNEGYNTEMTRLDDSQGRGRLDASYQAQIQGANQGLNEMQAGNNAIAGKLSLQQQIAQAMSSLRNQQVAGVSGMPTTTTTPSMQAPDLAGMINSNYANQMNAYNADQASNSSMLGGVLGLAGTLGGAFLGGPAGASLGGSLGGMLGGGGGAAPVNYQTNNQGLRQPSTGFWS